REANGKADAQAIDLNVGAIFGNASVYVKAGILGDGQATVNDGSAAPGVAIKAEFDRDSEYEVGGSYKLNNYTIFAQASMEEYTTKAGGAKGSFENSFYQIGVARTERLSDKTMMFVKLSAFMNDFEEKNGTKETTETMAVPVSIGFEHDATSWLTLRG